MNGSKEVKNMVWEKTDALKLWILVGVIVLAVGCWFRWKDRPKTYDSFVTLPMSLQLIGMGIVIMIWPVELAFMVKHLKERQAWLSGETSIRLWKG